ncbi:MAG: hypothetical protein AUJ97_05575 [Bacteroidetes bacterium CG2_30_32_10]|nr:MAG: hypothetical protein AUJ97_05575 [Bacteroidetes bacterium CG2_30_32_10]
MKKNKIIFAVTLLLIILALVLILKNTKSTLKGNQNDFAVKDTSSITKIFLVDKSNQSVLLKKIMPGKWTVNDVYAGKPEMINTLVETMYKLQVREPVPNAARNNVLKRLSSISTKVEVYQKVYRINLFGLKLFQHEKLTKTYYVGDNTQDLCGTYMLIEKASDPFIVWIPGFNGFLTMRYIPKEEDWRDATVFNLPFSKVKSVTVKYPSAPDSSFTINHIGERDFSLISLKDNKQIMNVDTIRILEYLSSFKLMKYEALLNKSDANLKDSVIKTTPFHIVTLTDINGKSITIKTFIKKRIVENNNEELPLNMSYDINYDPERMYALINNDKDFVLIQYYVFSRILRTIKFFEK